MVRKTVPSPESVAARRRFLEEEAQRLGTTIGQSSLPQAPQTRRRKERARRNLASELAGSDQNEEEEELEPQLVRRPRSERVGSSIPTQIENPNPPPSEQAIEAIPPVEEDAPIQGERVEMAEVERSNKAILDTLADLRREEEERLSGGTEILEEDTDVQGTDPLTPPEDEIQSQAVMVSPRLLEIPEFIPEAPLSPYNPVYERNEEEEGEKDKEEEDDGHFIVRRSTRLIKEKEASTVAVPDIEIIGERGPPEKEKKRKLSKKEKIKEMKPRTEPTRTSPRFAAQTGKESEREKEKATQGLVSPKQKRKRSDTEENTGAEVPNTGTVVPQVKKLKIVSPPRRPRTHAETSKVKGKGKGKAQE